MPRTGEVLVVEADPALAALIADVLSDEGYAVRVVGDVQGVHSAMVDRAPELVLCDLFLLGRAAVDFVITLHDDGFADLPIVLTTTDARAAERLHVPGVAFCLIKPFDLDDLLAVCCSAYSSADIGPTLTNNSGNPKLTGTPVPEAAPRHAAARTAVFDSIERFYNRQRCHSNLGYRSPADYEVQESLRAKAA